LVSWFSNCKIEAFGPLKPKALGCAGLSLMHQGNYKLLTYCCHIFQSNLTIPLLELELCTNPWYAPVL
jgi:hypothetical protein